MSEIPDKVTGITVTAHTRDGRTFVAANLVPTYKDGRKISTTGAVRLTIRDTGNELFDALTDRGLT